MESLCAFEGVGNIRIKLAVAVARARNFDNRMLLSFVGHIKISTAVLIGAIGSLFPMISWFLLKPLPEGYDLTCNFFDVSAANAWSAEDRLKAFSW